VNVAAPGTMDRHNRRVAVLEVCRAMMEGRCAAEPYSGMGCASPYAYETALRLLEIEEEIAGAHLPRTSSTVSCWAGRHVQRQSVPIAGGKLCVARWREV
jgi:hypothetical protein